METVQITKQELLTPLATLLKGKRLGRKYAFMEAGNIAWDCGEKELAKRFYDLSNEIKETE